MDVRSIIKPSSLRTVIAVLTLICCAAIQAVNAQESLLLINSYSENAPWSQSLTKPINQVLSNYPNVHLEMVSLNSAEIPDSATYRHVTDKIFNLYKSAKPSYVIMIGNFAFTMRDRIKSEWGDIPILLITRIGKYAPLSYYFSGYEGNEDWLSLPDIADIRSDYNMTSIETPDFCNENIDMITSIMPNIKKLVFIGNGVFTNRSLDRRIRDYLAVKYPHLQYEWLKATDSTMQQFQEYVLNRHPDTGFLISTWNNPANDDETVNLSSGDLYMIYSAVNPMFSMRESNMSLGAFGGVFHDTDKSAEAITSVIENMINGDNMRTLPMYTFNEPVPTVNYQRMQHLGYAESQMPAGTKYVLRVPSIWESYHIEIIAAIIILLLIIIGISIYMSVQRKRNHLLKTHIAFIKNMPWGYSGATILYDKKGEIYDIEYSLDNMNSAFQSILSANLLPGREWKIFPYEFIADKTRQLINDNAPVIFTYHFERTDTYYEFLICRINPQHIKPGSKPRHIDIFATEITPIIKAEQQLRSAMHTLDMTLTAASIIPWRWDVKKGEIKYEGLHRRKGFRLEASATGNPPRQNTITETNLIKAVHPDDRSNVMDMVRDLKDGNTDHIRAEFRLINQHNGKIRTIWVEINAITSEYDERHKPQSIIGSLLVITARKKQEVDLIAAKERASESDRLKSAFLANMSHEIRTPLNAIVGFSGLLTQTDDHAQKAKYTGIIEHNNDMLLHIINDVLDLSKIESNTLELHIVDTDLNELMETIYETISLRVAAGVKFNVVLGAEECNIKTDPNRLSQVLINLLTNAAKFTAKGSITYGYEINDDEIEFYVRDTGIGIAKDNLSKLFQRFSKLNNFMQGTGLGLSICKAFVEKMGGAIWAKSRGEGKGSTFYFTLPYVIGQRPANLEMAEGTIVEAPLETIDGEITILVGEPDDSNYLLFESILSDQYTLQHAYSTQQVADMYRENMPMIVLISMHLPQMDGFEAVRRIRLLSDNVPIVAITPNAYDVDRDRIFEAGFSACLSKPLNAKDLQKCIKAQLSRRFYVF